MPTYDYRCDACGHEMEIFQSMSEEPLTVCPECGNGGLRRLIGSGAGIIFRGSGFYETDYKRSRNSANHAKSSEQKRDRKSEKKSSDSKPKRDD
ncbi:MAG: FmdB family zinc ribbon protein [Planctomycetota bacterium]|jgi:putative FmdB family regulatory protein